MYVCVWCGEWFVCGGVCVLVCVGVCWCVLVCVCVCVCVCVPTGASPGHSYTVKSPPTSSSSDVTSVSTVFCSGLLLQDRGKTQLR